MITWVWARPPPIHMACMRHGPARLGPAELQHSGAPTTASWRAILPYVLHTARMPWPPANQRKSVRPGTTARDPPWSAVPAAATTKKTGGEQGLRFRGRTLGLNILYGMVRWLERNGWRESCRNPTVSCMETL